MELAASARLQRSECICLSWMGRISLAYEKHEHEQLGLEVGSIGMTEEHSPR